MPRGFSLTSSLLLDDHVKDTHYTHNSTDLSVNYHIHLQFFSQFDTGIVLTAAGLTALVTFGLTLFALQTKVSSTLTFYQINL